MVLNIVELKPGREKSLYRRHPWIFSGAIKEIIGNPINGETVGVTNSKGELLALGAYSHFSQIRIRVWSFYEGDKIGDEFFWERLSQAIRIRDECQVNAHSDAIRLVHGESDQIPGLIVDRYGDILVVQFLSSGAEYWRSTITDQLAKLTGINQIYERSDVEVRKLEGLPLRTGVLMGKEPSSRIPIQENELRFWVDIIKGHKTGFYLDQRQNRFLTRQFAKNRKVLDCFSYTGGFALSSIMGGAKSVLAVDESTEALTLAQENLALNGFLAKNVEWNEGDVFQVLRKLRDQAQSFDLIILDPPKFAPTASYAETAARGYKDINLLALKLLVPGGYLVTFSCSGRISEEFFRKIVAGAAVDAGVEARILTRLHQDSDHPVGLNFPEGAYLKGLILEVNY